MLCPNCFDDIPDNSPGCRHCGVNFARWAAGGDAAAPKGAKGKGKDKARPQGARAGAKSKGRARPREGWRFRPWRWAAALSLVVVLGWLAYWGAGPTLDRLSAVGTVVFVSTRDGNAELYALTPGQNVPVQLTRDAASDDSPSLSSDGRTIAFVSNRDSAEAIYVMNVDGSSTRRLPLPPGRNTHPLWSPDGRALAFVSDADGLEGPARPEVFVASADGQRAVNVSQSEASDAQPAWSPGSTRLAFVSDRDGRDRIYTVMADGSALAPLTPGAAPESSPAWSPDGQRVAYVSDGEVWVASLDGAAPHALTRGGNEPARASYAEPIWSPDASRLAAFRSVPQGASRTLELAVIEADGTVAASAPAEPGGVAWLDRDRMVLLTRPAAGRSWFTIQRYSGEPQVCLRSVRRATQAWLRPLDALTAGAFSLISKAPAVDSSLTVLTDSGAEALVWAPGTVRAAQ